MGDGSLIFVLFFLMFFDFFGKTPFAELNDIEERERKEVVGETGKWTYLALVL